jgi:hypothetical protein
MYYFAIEFQVEMPYPLAPPQGWEACRSLTIQQPAIGNWQFAGKTKPFRQASRQTYANLG